jgi:predicted 2-oxoglutarate/Fe(II)-dependent dioxygenase YbiX
MQPNIKLIEGALSVPELRALRAQLERRGFTVTAGRYPAGYRDNDRLVFDDPALAARLFAQLAPHLPREVTTVEGHRARLVGLNPRFRACRYRGGQSFQRHRDGAYAPTEAVRSERTLMLYLTDGAGHQGGRTRFYASADPSEPPLFTITPRAGLATVFPHDAWHDGEPVTEGTKVVLRSDLLYERASALRGSTSVDAEGAARGHRGYVWDVAPAGAGRWLSVGRDGTLRAWSHGVSGLRPVSTLALRLPSPTAISWSPGGVALVGGRHGQLASAAPDQDAPGAWREGPARRVQRGAVLALDARAGGFVSAGADGVVHMLDPDGAPVASHRFRRAGFLWGLASALPSVSDGEGEWLVGGEDGRVHRLVFDGRRLHEAARRPLGAPVRALAVGLGGDAWAGLSDGYIAAASEPAAQTGARRWSAHRGAVTALARVGTHHLVSGGEDGRVRCWDLRALDGAQPRRPGELHGRRQPGGPRELMARGDFITRLRPAGGTHVLAAGYDGHVTLSGLAPRSAPSHVSAPRGWDPSGTGAPSPHPR